MECALFLQNLLLSIKIMSNSGTSPNYRGNGIAKKLMGLLENWAVELGNTKAILETGKNQPEAIRLYKKIGYKIIENYQPYVGNDNSVCFSKELI